MFDAHLQPCFTQYPQIYAKSSKEVTSPNFPESRITCLFFNFKVLHVSKKWEDFFSTVVESLEF